VLISLAMFPGMLGGVAAPGSLLYRHPMYDLRWWWREFGRVSYIGGRDYHRPSLLSVEHQYPVFGETINAETGVSTRTSTIDKENVQSLLFRHDREKAWEFWNRRNRAHYNNFVRTIDNSLVSHATNNAPTRRGDSQMEDYWNGVDRDRQTMMTKFVRYGMTQANVQGLLWSVTDVDAKNGDGKPYSYWVSPLDVLDWEVDDNGEIQWLKQFIYVESRRKWSDGVIPRFRFRIWSKENVETWETDTRGTDKTLIGTVKNTIGIVPWNPLFSIKDEESVWPDGHALLGDLCKTANHIYNLGSLLSEIFYKQTFSWLAIPDKNVDTLQMGVATAFGYDPGLTHAEPKYLAPDPQQAMVLMKGMSDGLEQARQAVGVGRGRSEASMVKSSADALELESEDKRSILFDLAEAAQEWERRQVKILNAYRNIKTDTTEVNYPTEFNLRSLQQEIADATSVKALSISPEVDMAFDEGIVRRKFSNLAPNELNALVASIKAQNDKNLADAAAMNQAKLTQMKQPPAAVLPPLKPDPGDARGANPDETAPGAD
jgi:hypothetical protein